MTVQMDVRDLINEIARPFYQQGANFVRCDYDARTDRMSVRHARAEEGDFGAGFSVPGEVAVQGCRYMYNRFAGERMSHPVFRETERQVARLGVETDGVRVDLEFVSLPRGSGFTMLLFAISAAPILMADQIALVELEAARRLRARVVAGGVEQVVPLGQLERVVQEMCGVPGVGKRVSFSVEYFESEE